MKFIIPYSFLIIMAIFVLISIIRLMVYLYKLDRLLFKKHTEKWKYLTTLLGFGPGCQNPVRNLPFLFSNEDFGDKEVLRLKIIVKHSLLYVLTGLPALAISIGIVIKLMYKLK